MPKTKDAFAFRDFDAERILQRNFFRELNLPEMTDEEILQSFKAADENSIDVMEEKLHTVKATYERLEKYRRLINRHYQTRCDKYNKSKARALGVKVPELKRAAPTLDYFTAELSCIELIDKLGKIYCELEKQIQRQYRLDFSARLKKARIAAGLTQKQLGDLIQISPNGYGQYENGKRDPSIPTIFRLLRILPAEQLLGIDK